MRIAKFVIYLGLLSGALVMGWPRWAVQVELLVSPVAYAPFVPAWWIWGPLGLAVLGYSLYFLWAACLRRSIALWQHGVVIALFGAVLLLRVFGEWASPPEDPLAREPSPAWLMSQAAARLQAGLRAGSARAPGDAPALLPADEEAVRALLRVDGELPLSGYRRHAFPARLELELLLDAQGPALQVRPGDKPGTLYLALAPERRQGWITLVGLSGRSTSEAAIMRDDGGAPFVLPVP